MLKRIILSCSVLGLAALPSCTQEPTNQTKWMFMPDMVDSPVVKPMREYLDPPDGSVASNAILYPKTAEESEKALQSPLSQLSGSKLDDHRKKGAHLFEIYCSLCHGQDAKGMGTVTSDGKFPKPPDLTTQLQKDRGDGFFFHRITFGTAIMPQYGHSTDPLERWQIVLHLRDLQKTGG